MFSIRRSRAEEVDSLVQIWRRAVDATHDFLAPADRAAIDVEVQQLFPTVPIWVAVDQADRPFGFMIMSEREIQALFVDPGAHRRGAGRLLVEHAIKLCDTLTTDVNEQNVQAVRFYERLQFVRTGRSPKDHKGRSYPILHLRLQRPGQAH